MVSRLFQIVYLLMEHESMTAGELSERLEVSVRTINRDIEKLSEARIPIYATRGRSGGISLLSDFVLNKKVLTEEEKSSILSSMRVMGAVGYEDEKQALNRLEEFFGASAQDWIEVELDTWGEGHFDRERFRGLKDAILCHKKIVFDYMGRGEGSSRTIHPYRLVFRSQAWYVYGFCELRQDYRHFKLHRISKLEVLEERFEPQKLPVIEKEHYLPGEETFTAKIRFDESVAYRVYDEIPAWFIHRENGQLMATITNAESSWLYGLVLSYGPAAEVLEPQSVREELRRQVALLYQKYDNES